MQTAEAPLTDTEAAVSGIAVALNPLQPDDAMAALIEMQALLLASAGHGLTSPPVSCVMRTATLRCRRRPSSSMQSWP